MDPLFFNEALTSRFYVQSALCVLAALFTLRHAAYTAVDAHRWERLRPLRPGREDRGAGCSSAY